MTTPILTTSPDFFFYASTYAILRSWEISFVVLDRKQIIYTMNGGVKFAVEYPDTATALADYKVLATALDVNQLAPPSGGPPVINSIFPAWGYIGDATSLILIGQNLRLAAGASVTFSDSGTGIPIAGTIDEDDPSQTWLIIHAPNTLPLGWSQITYTDPDGNQVSYGDGNASGFRVDAVPTGGLTMQPYYDTYNDPNTEAPGGMLHPADETLPAYFIGNGQTLYFWDTVNKTSWIGLITA